MDLEQRINSRRLPLYGRRKPAGVQGGRTRAPAFAGGRHGGYSGRAPAKVRPAAAGQAGVSAPIARSALIGQFAALCVALLGDASPPVLLVSTLGAGVVGALLGLALWLGSVEAPEDPVLPPRPADRRAPKAQGERERP